VQATRSTARGKWRGGDDDDDDFTIQEISTKMKKVKRCSVIHPPTKPHSPLMMMRQDVAHL